MRPSRRKANRAQQVPSRLMPVWCHRGKTQKKGRKTRAKIPRMSGP